jgi:hypothetical protein
MDPLVLLLRLVHVLAGAIWVGMAVFASFYLTPAIQEVGPDGGKVMAALQRRGVMVVMPLLALGTLVSGFWLYWRDSMGLQPGWAGSATGIGFGAGGLFALAAWVVGMAVLRPSMMRAVALGQGLAGSLPEAERASRAEEIARLRGRSAAAGRIVAVFLLLATALMAVARYL